MTVHPSNAASQLQYMAVALHCNLQPERGCMVLGAACMHARAAVRVTSTMTQRPVVPRMHPWPVASAIANHACMNARMTYPALYYTVLQQAPAASPACCRQRTQPTTVHVRCGSTPAAQRPPRPAHRTACGPVGITSCERTVLRGGVHHAAEAAAIAPFQGDGLAGS